VRVGIALRWLYLPGLAALLACSTPISFEPQVEDEEEDAGLDAGRPSDAGLDAGRPSDAAVRDAESGTALPDAARDAATCEIYAAPECPRDQPRTGSRCSQNQLPETYCYYPGPTASQLQVAQCKLPLPGSGGSLWQVSPARCSYRCSTELPQTSNFFSLLTDGCAARPVTDCHAALARTSQEGVDRYLRDFVTGCGLQRNFQLGVSFNQQGCADWVHYQDGPRLTSAQSQCLSNRLEAVRFGCDVSCALTPSTAP
jgi:hypothetical protein